MHVIDVVLDSFSNLFRPHSYSPLEKLYSVVLFIAGLSLRDLSERLCLIGASRESVRIWVHRFSSLFMPSRKVRKLVAVDETVRSILSKVPEVKIECSVLKIVYERKYEYVRISEDELYGRIIRLAVEDFFDERERRDGIDSRE
jgi:hypothetical protein